MRSLAAVALLCLAGLGSARCFAQNSGDISCDVSANCSGKPFQCSLTLIGEESVSPHELKERAKGIMERQALELHCYRSVRSTTLVQDAMVRSDKVWSSLHGLITSFNQDLWQADLTAGNMQAGDVKWRMKATLTANQLKSSGSPDVMHVSVSLEESYRVGESATIGFNLSQQGYVYIFAISGDTVSQLLPWPGHPENEYLAGFNQFPSKEDTAANIKLTLTDDPSQKSKSWREHFLVVASKKKIDFSKLNLKVPINHALLVGESANQYQLASFLLQQDLSSEDVDISDVEYVLVRPNSE